MSPHLQAYPVEAGRVRPAPAGCGRGPPPPSSRGGREAPRGVPGPSPLPLPVPPWAIPRGGDGSLGAGGVRTARAGPRGASPSWGRTGGGRGGSPPRPPVRPSRAGTERPADRRTFCIMGWRLFVPGELKLQNVGVGKPGVPPFSGDFRRGPSGAHGFPEAGHDGGGRVGSRVVRGEGPERGRSTPGQADGN
jgi:hypothetical protein